MKIVVIGGSGLIGRDVTTSSRDLLAAERNAGVGHRRDPFAAHAHGFG